MRSNAIPAEFEDLLNASGGASLPAARAVRRAGQSADALSRPHDLLDRAKAERVRRAAGAVAGGQARADGAADPARDISEMRHDYGELLPKTSRAHTIYFESRRERGVKAAERIGLVR